MVDWEPSIGLPESDFIELYNRSEYALQLKDWELFYGGSRKILPDYQLEPNEYLLIVENEMGSSFWDYGNYIEMLSSSTLPSANKSLMLKDTTGLLIDSIFYKKSWYHDPEKEDGGWTLERIDFENHCANMANWTASNSLIGGTPGLVNSVYSDNPDLIAPIIFDFKPISNNRIKVFFSEGIPSSSLLETSNYQLQNSEAEN